MSKETMKERVFRARTEAYMDARKKGDEKAEDRERRKLMRLIFGAPSK